MDFESIQCSDISFAYGTRSVLREVSFSVQDGEFVGVVGPNGSGKTTLLKILSGLFKASSGVVRLSGKVLGDLSVRERAKMLAVVPQENYFSFPFTVLEAVLLGRYPHLGGLAREGEKDLVLARQVLKRLQLDGFEDRLVTDLSGGEKQRVVVARALAQEPKILLLDEPTTFLDIGQQLQICTLLKNCCEQDGITIVAVFHDLHLASFYCDRIILLEDGRIHSTGKPKEILTRDTLASVFHADLTMFPSYWT